MLPSVKREMVRALNAYCFRQVWNEIGAEYRVNLRLTPVPGRFPTGNVTLGRHTVALPSAGDAYAVFSAGLPLFHGGLPIAADTWLSAAQVLASARTLLYLYPASGLLLPLDAVYVRYQRASKRVLVAVKKAPLVKILAPAEYRQLYLTVYRDSDQPNAIRSWSFAVPSLTPAPVLAQIDDRIATCRALNAAGTTVLVNGRERDSGKPLSYGAGDYVDVVLDENVIGAYTVNVSAGRTGFFSAQDQRYKEILHCPKALNPTNRLITHNTCTMYVRANAGNHGRFLHRAELRSIGQLTHNDLCLDTAVLDAFRAHLGTADVSVHVQVRTHATDNVLLPDRAFLPELYACDDATIVRHLRGELDAALAFWTAPALEQHGYVRLMFDTPNSLDPSVLDTYVDSLGYHEVAALLASHTRHTTVPAAPMGHFRFDKPFVLQNLATHPLVYLDGRKLRTDQVVHRDYADGTVALGFASGVVHSPGQRLDVCLVEAGAPVARRVVVSAEAPSVEVAWPGVQVFELQEGLPPVLGRVSSSTAALLPRAVLPGTLEIDATEAGGSRVVFGPSQYGKTMLLLPAAFVYTHTTTVDATIAAGEPLVLPLRLTIDGEATTVPLCGHRSLEVYVNGHYLVPGLDYTAVPRLTADGATQLVEVVLATYEYLADAPNNRVEVVAHTSATLSQDAGFAVNDRLSYDRSTTLWYDGLSRVFIGGRLTTGVIDRGTWLQPPAPVPNVQPYEVRTMVPAVVAAALADYTPALDADRRAAIDRYFARSAALPAEDVVIAHSHRLYSPYLSAIIADCLGLAFQPVDEPSRAGFLAQFTGYAALQAADAALSNPRGLVDPRYVDVTPHYTVPTVADPTLHKILNRLADYVLPSDPHSLGDF